MDGIGGNQQNIPLLQQIIPSFDQIPDIAGQKQDQFMKFMIMVWNISASGIFQMKQPERYPRLFAFSIFPIEISLHVLPCLTLFYHNNMDISPFSMFAAKKITENCLRDLFSVLQDGC